MILVLTSEAGDYSHLPFIDWLEFYKADYEILSGEGIFSGKLKISIIDSQLFVNGRNYTEDVNVVFNRRWLTVQELPNISIDQVLNRSLKNTLSSELYEIRNFLDYNLKNAIWIPNVKKLNVNKLTILQKAKDIGLKVPDYIITNDKSELITFFNKYQNIISKAIGNFPKNYSSNNFLINPIYTKVVTKHLINILPNNFFLSIFQQLIFKKKEYRVLYFYGECFPVEILSQENDYSSIDSRKKNNKYDEIRLIKTIIPDNVVFKIIELMKEIDLNIGSIDILQSINNEYYFLEVNPVGQISGYSSRTNLNFEKRIVKKMIELDNGIKR